jgi:hypothetical protein
MENSEKKSGFKMFKVLFNLVTLVAIVAAGYFYWQLRELKMNPQAVAEKEAQALVAKVGRLIVLPEGETPTVATVSDPQALKDQVFFAKASAGDKVLIFTTAKKAFLYSVTLNKILEVAPLNIGDNKATSASTTPTQ